MKISQEIIHNVNHETALAYVTLDYEGRLLRRKQTKLLLVTLGISITK